MSGLEISRPAILRVPSLSLSLGEDRGLWDLVVFGTEMTCRETLPGLRCFHCRDMKNRQSNKEQEKNKSRV